MIFGFIYSYNGGRGRLRGRGRGLRSGLGLGRHSVGIRAGRLWTMHGFGPRWGRGAS